MGGATTGGKAGGAAAKSGNGNSAAGGKRALAVLPDEDISKLIPCPVTTAHRNGFVERTEPNRETHEVR